MSLRICAGSGQRPHGEGWINCDVQERWRQAALDKGGEFICCDMASMPFEDGSAEIVVSHHCIEHEGCGEAAGAVKEAYRVLKPGGSFLVFVPDMCALAKRWLEGGLTTQIYMTNVYGAFMGDQADRHRWGYDEASLFEFLASCCPWSRIERFDWREIPGADLARDFWILDCEALK